MPKETNITTRFMIIKYIQYKTGKAINLPILKTLNIIINKTCMVVLAQSILLFALKEIIPPFLLNTNDVTITVKINEQKVNEEGDTLARFRAIE